MAFSVQAINGESHEQTRPLGEDERNETSEEKCGQRACREDPSQIRTEDPESTETRRRELKVYCRALSSRIREVGTQN